MRSVRHRNPPSGFPRGCDALGLGPLAMAGGGGGPAAVLGRPPPPPPPPEAASAASAVAASAMMMMNVAAAATATAGAPSPAAAFHPPLTFGAMGPGFASGAQPIRHPRPLPRQQQQRQWRQPGTKMRINTPLFSQLGLGVSRPSSSTAAAGDDATESAVLAVRDALGKTALPHILGAAGGSSSREAVNDGQTKRRGRRLLAQIKLGVPAAAEAHGAGVGSRQWPMRLDRSAVMRQAAPYGEMLPVDVTLGGLVVEDDADDEDGNGGGLCVVVASVTVGYGCLDEDEDEDDDEHEDVATSLSSRSEEKSAGRPPSLMAGGQGRAARAQEPGRAVDTAADCHHRQQNHHKKRATLPLRSNEAPEKIEKRQRQDHPLVDEKCKAVAEVKKEKKPAVPGISSDCPPEKGDEEAKDATRERPAMPSAAVPSSPRLPPPASGHPANQASAAVNPSDFSIHSHPTYVDHASELPTPAELAQFEDLSLSYKTPPFPIRLHRLLEEVSRSGRSCIVGWLSHGRAFRVLDVDAFVHTILPEYFRLTKYCSFLRQLNLYGFRRIGTGPDRGSYYSEWFLRGRPVLTSRMRRVRVNGNGRRIASDPDTEPDLYVYPALEEADGQVPTTSTAAATAAVGRGAAAALGEATGSVVSSEDTVLEDDAGGGLLALRGGGGSGKGGNLRAGVWRSISTCSD